MDKKRDLIQGTLDLLILKTVARGGPLHGYAIAQVIFDHSRQTLDIQQGSLYPALHRLERRKLIASQWRETESGRMAKFYALTPAGRKQFTADVASWTSYVAAVNLILES
jgi:transcriptional regulator